MRANKSILVIFLLLVFSHCWKKQQHEIVAPKIPNYNLSGTIQDIDSGEIISGSEVKLTAISLVYAEAEFNGAIDTSDVLGHYEFQQITPGTYQITVKRGKYEVKTEIAIVEHSDKYFDIKLPKVLLAHLEYKAEGYRGTREFPRFNGICWKAQSTLAGIWQWQEHGDDMPRWRIVEGKYGSGFNIVGEHGFRKENPKMWGLTYLYNYWTCGSSGSKPKIYAIYPGKGYVESEVNMPYPMLDMTNDGTNLWATASVGKIIKFGVHASIIENEYDFPSGNPAGIAWDGAVIWTNDSIENLIYKHDSEMVVDKTYRPIFEDQRGVSRTISTIKYLSFDYEGNLWACDGLNVYLLEVNE